MDTLQPLWTAHFPTMVEIDENARNRLILSWLVRQCQHYSHSGSIEWQVVLNWLNGSNTLIKCHIMMNSIWKHAIRSRKNERAKNPRANKIRIIDDNSPGKNLDHFGQIGREYITWYIMCIHHVILRGFIEVCIND